MNLHLPDLSAYRSSFLQKGVIYPLPTVATKKDGLLKILPSAPPDKTGWPWTEESSPIIYNPNITWPRLTIITPSFNQDKFLEQTIRSVLLQNYPNLEYVVIDGGSTDGSKKIIEKYAPWISYWQSEKDNGQSHAINLGFSLASGSYMAWINSDDYYLKDVFYMVISHFLSAKVDFVYGQAYNLHVKTARFELLKVHPLLDYFIRIPTLAQPSCFWSNKIHQPIWEDLHCSLDYELWLRLVKGNSRRLINRPLSVANVHENAKTSSPKMDAARERDHQLICSKNAHGPVYDWHKRIFFHRIYNRIYNLLYKVSLK
ncbi:glycosyltransferase family 2 protein [Mucilaginibacter sp. FT3.2]|uniref:glycosyltransferase family 2 protein n=1 Tax=Mucilaginibacter sp. FT3.2 TaxID=2723090 RepID=UPI0017CABB4D|nr:glycosyltransferase family 2 protein [Mucilaginibacter sp. FT3.2]MBB6231302.1 glycosyltransferase involved in cell wall biosynthesis [Mucilaginibacter sp. FT3.2]